MRVGLTALTMAEYFRDINKQDVLLLCDSFFINPLGWTEGQELAAQVFDSRRFHINSFSMKVRRTKADVCLVLPSKTLEVKHVKTLNIVTI